MMRLTLATWQPVRRGLVAAGRAAAGGPALHVGSLALALAIGLVALRTLTAPAGPVERPIVAEDGVPAEPAPAMRVRRPVPSADAVPARPRPAPTYYVVDSDERAAEVAQAIDDAYREAHGLGVPVQDEHRDARVIVLAGGEARFDVAREINAERQAAGLPEVTVVDLRAR